MSLQCIYILELRLTKCIQFISTAPQLEICVQLFIYINATRNEVYASRC